MNQSILPSLATLCSNLLFQVSELKQPKQVFQPLNQITLIHMSILPLQERTSKQWSVDSPITLDISAITNCKHHRRPKTLLLLTAFPSDRILQTLLPGPTEGKRIHPHAGQVEG